MLKLLFNITKQEHKGLISFIIVISSFAIIYSLLAYYFRDSNQTNVKISIVEDSLIQRLGSNHVSSIKIEKIKPFNPNNLKESEWEDLGFNKTVANRILKFKNKIGGFSSKEDLLKVYGIDKNMISNIEQYLVFDSIDTKSHILANTNEITQSKAQVLIQINSTTEEELQKCKGIGEVLAKRIIKFRQKLGGFHSLKQLYEVYGIDSTKINIKEFELKLNEVAKLDLTKLTFKEMVNHPYIGYKNAKIISSYIKQHPDFKNKDYLLIRETDNAFKNKIQPYLNME